MAEVIVVLTIIETQERVREEIVDSEADVVVSLHDDLSVFRLPGVRPKVMMLRLNPQFSVFKFLL